MVAIRSSSQLLILNPLRVASRTPWLYITKQMSHPKDLVSDDTRYECIMVTHSDEESPSEPEAGRSASGSLQVDHFLNPITQNCVISSQKTSP